MYLRGRGIDDQIIKEFDIGFASQGNQLEKFLLSKGISHEIMILSHAFKMKIITIIFMIGSVIE